MSQTARLPAYSPEDYLRNEEAAATKHEYLNGEVYAMAGASARHNRIALNAAYILRTATRGGPCAVFIADMKLRLVAQNAFYYPDVMVACRQDDDHPHYKTAPCLVVEVLSPSTEAIDRREKWLAYSGLESLEAYLLVDSEQRRVDYYIRSEDRAWARGTLEANEVLNLTCAGRAIPVTLEDLYEDVGL